MSSISVATVASFALNSPFVVVFAISRMSFDSGGRMLTPNEMMISTIEATTNDAMVRMCVMYLHSCFVLSGKHRVSAESVSSTTPMPIATSVCGCMTRSLKASE